MNNCPYCQAVTGQKEVGRSKTGLHTYQCLHCDQLYFLEGRHRDLPGSDQSVSEGMIVDPNDSASTTKHADETALRGFARNVHTAPETTVHWWTNIFAGRSKRIPVEAIASPSLGHFPVSTGSGVMPKTGDAALSGNRWGWMPELALIQALGLLVLSWAFMGARAATPYSDVFWWVGLAVMILPVTLRLASVDASRQERLALVLVLGMALYLVKVMHSPVAFTFPDELSHLRNVREIIENQRLFHENPIQPVTAYYPGLPIVTSTLSSLSGLSIFHSGLLVIGATRLILFLALYLLFEQVGGSARVAGLATVLYMCNPNFLYWTAEYAYEPLALPLLIFVLLMVAKREMGEDRTHSGAWTLAALLGVLTVVITHHMSSYILTLLLMAITMISIVYSRGKRWGPWPVALVALSATAVWLLFIADLTIDYLSPVLSAAFQSVFKMIAEEETGRELFKSTTLTSEARAPVWEQFVAMGSVVIITLGLPLGLLEIWQRHRSKIFAVLLGTIALAYLPVQMLRFTKDGWETANRSSEFLFIGIAFVIALGVARFWLSNWTSWLSRLLLAGLSVALFFGGLIAGWPPRARLARPYIIGTGDHVVRPQVVTVAEWMAEHLGPDNRVAASKADAKVIGAYGQYPFTDNGPIRNLFLSDEFGKTELRTLLKRDIQYVVSDSKVVSWDHMIGYYFYSSQSTRTSDLRLFDTEVAEKLDGFKGISRILDSGNIVVYGVESYLEAYDESEATAKQESSVVSTPDAQLSTGNSAGPTAGDGSSAPPSIEITWNGSPGEATLGARQAGVSEISRPSCEWYTVESLSIRIDLRMLWSMVSAGPGPLECRDRSGP